jgi:hypothetical protein
MPGTLLDGGTTAIKTARHQHFAIGYLTEHEKLSPRRMRQSPASHLS